MERAKVTPKDFFLWAGAMAALYVGVFNYIGLLWDYIDYAIPDSLQYHSADPYQSGISWEMASIIVLLPAFLALMWFIRRDIAKDASRRDIWVRRWALYLTLFIAGASIVIDLIWVLYAFLNGIDLTTHFLLKALVVLLVAAIGFMHFLADMWNYWEQYPQRNRYVAIASVILVVVTVVAGFFIVGTPTQARLYRFDQQKVYDLQNIQSEVVTYWQAKQKLPATLADLHDPIRGFSAPNDPQSGGPYLYKITGRLSFQLCATFNAATRGTRQDARPAAPYPAEAPGMEDNWQHGAGEVCFDRTIDPQRYPPLPKGIPQ